MTDRELLEASAKAVGHALSWDDHGNPGYWSEWRGLPQWESWNPLDDAGDALRLAIELCMSLSTGPVEATANTISGALRGNFFKEDTVGQSQHVAVRRVIVCAAAEVGSRR